MRRWLVVFVVSAMVVAACGGSEGEAEDGIEITTASSTAENDDGGGDGSSSDGNGQTGNQDSPDDTSPDDDDFGEIVGNPDLDTEDLGPAADLADDIDDIVSLGDCVAVGLMATAPPDYQCRVLDQPVGGMDGFTMFGPGNELNITIGSPSPLGAPCEILQACDDAEPIALSDNFPDTMILDLFGTISIWGTHATGAELVITKGSALTDQELQDIMDVLDSVVEV